MIEVDNIYLYLIQIKGKLKKLDGKMFKVAKNVVELRPHQVLYWKYLPEHCSETLPQGSEY